LNVPRNIGEWHAIPIFDFSYLRFKLLAILFLGSLFFIGKGKRLWEVGIIIIALIYAFRHQRHTAVFAIVVAPFLVESLSAIIAQRLNFYEKIRSSPSYLILKLFLIIIIGYQLFSTSSKYIKAEFNIIVDPQRYPIYAVNFLKANKIEGNILLPFEWGEYVIWKLYPGSKVSIDGRFRTVYPEEVLEDHFLALINRSKWEKLLDKYPTDIILAKRNLFSQQMISIQKKWRYIYSDTESIIFIKRNKSNKNIFEKIKKKQLIYPQEGLTTYFP